VAAMANPMSRILNDRDFPAFHYKMLVKAVGNTRKMCFAQQVAALQVAVIEERKQLQHRSCVMNCTTSYVQKCVEKCGAFYFDVPEALYDLLKQKYADILYQIEKVGDHDDFIEYVREYHAAYVREVLHAFSYWPGDTYQSLDPDFEHGMYMWAIFAAASVADIILFARMEPAINAELLRRQSVQWPVEGHYRAVACHGIRKEVCTFYLKAVNTGRITRMRHFEVNHFLCVQSLAGA